MLSEYAASCSAFLCARNHTSGVIRVHSLSETVIDLYRCHAAQWIRPAEAALGTIASGETFVRELGQGSCMLGLGCGGGDPVARLLIDHGIRVSGVESSPEMMALARERLPQMEWITAHMRGLALHRRFDGISLPARACVGTCYVLGDVMPGVEYEYSIALHADVVDAKK